MKAFLHGAIPALTHYSPVLHFIWDKVFKNGPSEICRRQPLNNLKGNGLLKHITSNFLKAAFHKFQPVLEYFVPYKAYQMTGISCVHVLTDIHE